MAPASGTLSTPVELREREARPFPRTVGECEVRSVRQVSPRTVRIGFVGPDLDAFVCEEAGEIVTLVWPRDPGAPIVLPPVGRWSFPAEAEGQHTRNYTVREHDRGSGELRIDFVLHGDEGRCSAWAARAAPGQRLGFCGPRTHWTAEPDAAWNLMVADETGLPALAAQLDALPDGQRAVAVIEVHDERERQVLPARDGVDVHWVSREGAPAGPSDRLADAVRRLELPAGPGQAWGACEARSARALREHLRDERGLAGGAVRVLGYWKHRATPTFDG